MAVKVKNLFHSFKRKVSTFAKKSSHFLNSLFFKNVFYQETLQALFFTYILVLFYYFTGMNEDLSLRLSLSRKFSNFIKFLTRIPIPRGLRKIIFKTYANIYDVNLSEILEDYMKFKNFNEFFTRKIKPRDIKSSISTELVSPADSKILSLSEVTQDECVLLKGRYYRLGELLTGIKDHKLSPQNVQEMKHNPNNKLYQCVFYLNPGDYHRFHSPADFLVTCRNHIVGYLLPVKESYIMKHEKVYEINERVSLFGEWKYGFMAMVMVGAMNVGTIALNFDKDLTTNTKLKKNFSRNHFKDYTPNNKDHKSFLQKDFLFRNFGRSTPATRTRKNSGSFSKNSLFKQSKMGITVAKGDEMGRFNMGSTIVVLFEAAPDFELSVSPGTRVAYGQRIGNHEKDK